MNEKSLEEMMSDLSDVTVSSTGDTFTVNMNNELPEVVSAVSQSPIDLKPEVQEMVEENENQFYNQNITKDMDVLEKEYVKMERDAAIIDAKYMDQVPVKAYIKTKLKLLPILPEDLEGVVK